MDRKRYNEAFDVRSFENDCFLNCSLFSMISIGFQKTEFLEISEKSLRGICFLKNFRGTVTAIPLFFIFRGRPPADGVPGAPRPGKAIAGNPCFLPRISPKNPGML